MTQTSDDVYRSFKWPTSNWNRVRIVCRIRRMYIGMAFRRYVPIDAASISSFLQRLCHIQRTHALVVHGCVDVCASPNYHGTFYGNPCADILKTSQKHKRNHNEKLVNMVWVLQWRQRSWLRTVLHTYCAIVWLFNSSAIGSFGFRLFVILCRSG